MSIFSRLKNWLGINQCSCKMYTQDEMNDQVKYWHDKLRQAKEEGRKEVLQAKPLVVEHVKEVYTSKDKAINNFLRDMCVVGKDEYIEYGQLYDLYATHCKNTGVPSKPKRAFSNHIRKKIKSIRLIHTSGSESLDEVYEHRFYVGIGYKYAIVHKIKYKSMEARRIVSQFLTESIGSSVLLEDIYQKYLTYFPGKYGVVPLDKQGLSRCLNGMLLCNKNFHKMIGRDNDREIQNFTFIKTPDTHV